MERSFSIVLIKTTLIDRAIKVVSRRCGERVIEHRSGVISNNSADNSANNQSANELVIATAVVMLVASWGRRRRLTVVNMIITIVMIYGLGPWCRTHAVGVALVSVARTYTMGGGFAMAGATVMIAA